jgi:retinol dehydrogenase-14
MIRRSTEASMKGKTVLVTGGNSGIGLETAVALARAGAHVGIVSRSAAKGAVAAADVTRRSGQGGVSLFVADLSSQAEIRRLADEVLATFPRLDVLVNNAGAIHGERSTTVDGIETTLAVNHLAYFLLTHLLLDRLTASAPSRVVNVASEAHRRASLDFEDLQGERAYGGWRAYCQSKLANIVFTYELARRLEGRGVTANCLHPGVVATNFGTSGSAPVRVLFTLIRPFLRSPAKGAATTIHLSASKDVEGVTGRYFVDEREAPSSPASYEREAWGRLWMVSEALTGLTASARGDEASPGVGG